MPNRQLHHLLIITSVSALCACGADSESSSFVYRSGHLVPADGVVVSREQPSPTPWDRVALSIEEADIGVESFDIKGDASLLGPVEGTYDETKVYYERLCGPAAPDGAIAVLPRVTEVDTDAGTFVQQQVDPDTGEVFLETPCELDGWRFRCDIADQVMDFNEFFGLDAVVTVESTNFGFWFSPDRYIDFSGQEFTCEGPDCGVEPASNFFGTIYEMPCQSLAITRNEAIDD